MFKLFACFSKSVLKMYFTKDDELDWTMGSKNIISLTTEAKVKEDCTSQCHCCPQCQDVKNSKYKE